MPVATSTCRIEGAAQNTLSAISPRGLAGTRTALRQPSSLPSVPEWAFAGVPRLRHVSVESGIRLIGAEAWQDCRQLRIVKLPATVVGIADNAFRDCKLLNSVLAPGCRDFCYKAFSECCSLQRVYASGGTVNVFNGEANFGQYLFQGCINLAEVTLSEFPSPRSESKGSTLQDRTRELAPGCLSSTGIYTLALPKHFVAIGAHACDSCQLLKSVDLCNTMIEEILDCTALRRLVKMPGTRKWRGVYAEENAFAICPAMKWPLWLHMIPDMGYTPGLG